MEKIQNNACMIKVTMSGSAVSQEVNHVIGPNLTDNNCQEESRMKTELEYLCLGKAGRQFMQALQHHFATTTDKHLYQSQSLHPSF